MENPSALRATDSQRPSAIGGRQHPRSDIQQLLSAIRRCVLPSSGARPRAALDHRHYYRLSEGVPLAASAWGRGGRYQWILCWGAVGSESCEQQREQGGGYCWERESWGGIRSVFECHECVPCGFDQKGFGGSSLPLVSLAPLKVQGYVQGSPVTLSYYNNIMSTVALVPMVVISGELPGALRLIGGEGAKTFLWGASITVRPHSVQPLLKLTSRASLASSFLSPRSCLSKSHRQSRTVSQLLFFHALFAHPQ